MTPEEQAKRNNRSQWTGENGELDWEKILKKVLIGAWEEALDDYKTVLTKFIVPGLSVANTIKTVVELVNNIRKDPDYLRKLKESLVLDLKMKVDGIGDLLTGDFDGFTENYTPEEGGASLYRLAQAIVSAKATKKFGLKPKSNPKKIRAWIKHDVYNEAVGNKGRGNVEKFIDKMKLTIEKGKFTTAKNESGIKVLNTKVNGKFYQFELKLTKGQMGDYRFYGNYDSNGVIVFDYFDKALH